MSAALTTDKIEALNAENKNLKLALLLAIPWIGQFRDGPAWATPEAKKKNRGMCDEAFEAATSFFPGGCPSDVYEELAKYGD